jgi:hypothetical protein
MSIHKRRIGVLKWFYVRGFDPMKCLRVYYPQYTIKQRKNAKNWLYSEVESEEGELIWRRLQKKMIRNETRKKVHKG